MTAQWRSRSRFVGVAALPLALLTFAAGPAAASPTASLGDCGWPAKADPEKVNIAYPDEGAQYWIAPFTAAPGTGMTIRGHFPKARYMSLHVYEGSVPVDALADVDITPEQGTNPFLPGASRKLGGSYSLRVVPGPRPADAAPNTLYAPGLNGEPNPAGVIIYRIYLPEGNQQGGVPLPEISFSAGGSGPSLSPPVSCELAPVGNTGVNDRVRESSTPGDLSAGSKPSTRKWRLSRSTPASHQVGPLTATTGNPFFANFHNEYLSLFVPKTEGEVVAFKAKAPTFPNTRGAPRMGTGELRYWSICTNDQPTTRYVACRADEQIRLDRKDYFTVVVSDPAHRPRSLRRTDNWIPAGPYPGIQLILRHMLPTPDFAGAMQRVEDASDPASSMGEYYPNTRACSTAAFERDRCGLPQARGRAG
jgi:hypothetical protein